MSKSVFILGFLSSFFLGAGFFFKAMHWPMANILVGFGFLFLNFGFLPAYFYQKYKMAQ